MDMTDILGDLLGRKSGAGGGGGAGDILRDILGGGRREAAPPAERRTGAPPSSDDIAAQARELEDLLNVAKGRQTRPAPQAEPRASAPRPAPTAPPSARPAPQRAPAPVSRQDELSLLLVRAMLNAAKCDGQITPEEQQAILEQLGTPSADVLQFLREEIQRSLDVREFAFSVPLGMEPQVYGMSLLALGTITPRESAYLDELAQGLRLSPQVREQLHARYAR